METFSTLLAPFEGNPPVTDKFPSQRPVTWEFTGDRWIPLTKSSDAEICFIFDLRLNKRLSKQSRRWWFATIELIMTSL